MPSNRFQYGNRKANPPFASAGNGIVLDPFVLSQLYEPLEIYRSSVRTHLGSEPNGRLEEPWRSAPRKIRKVDLSTKWIISELP